MSEWQNGSIIKLKNQGFETTAHKFYNAHKSYNAHHTVSFITQAITYCTVSVQCRFELQQCTDSIFCPFFTAHKHTLRSCWTASNYSLYKYKLWYKSGALWWQHRPYITPHKVWTFLHLYDIFHFAWLIFQPLDSSIDLRLEQWKAAMLQPTPHLSMCTFRIYSCVHVPLKTSDVVIKTLV